LNIHAFDNKTQTSGRATCGAFVRLRCTRR